MAIVTIVMKAFGWFLSPIGKIFGYAAMVLIFIAAVFAKGKSAGKAQERERSRKAVKEVEAAMDEEYKRPVKKGETESNLKKGKF